MGDLSERGRIHDPHGLRAFVFSCEQSFSLSRMKPFPEPGDGLEVEPADVADWLSVPGSIRLLDCREEDEHAFCRIDGSVLVPLSRFAEAVADALPEAPVPVVVYCHHGMRSARAAGYLRDKGHAAVFSLRGGIDAWSREIDPSVPTY